MEIDFYSIELRGDMADAQYFLTDARGTANVQQQISREQLIQYVKDKELHITYWFDEPVNNDPETYLEENYYEIIKQYVTDYAN